MKSGINIKPSSPRDQETRRNPTGKLLYARGCKVSNQKGLGGCWARIIEHLVSFQLLQPRTPTEWVCRSNHPNRQLLALLVLSDRARIAIRHVARETRLPR